jgi:hypothetical protein
VFQTTLRLSLALSSTCRACSEADFRPFSSAVGADLQALYATSGVLRQADRAVAEIRAQRRDVHARVRLERAGRQLVDVALALQIAPRPADVGDVDDEAKRISRCTPVATCRRSAA